MLWSLSTIHDPQWIALENRGREGEPNTRSFGEASREVAIKGFGGATLLSTNSNEWNQSKVMGLEFVVEEINYFIRFRRRRRTLESSIERTTIARGQMGVGSIIAWLVTIMIH